MRVELKTVNVYNNDRISIFLYFILRSPCKLILCDLVLIFFTFHFSYLMHIRHTPHEQHE